MVERFTGRSKESIIEQLIERLGAETAGLRWSRLIQCHRDAVDLGLDPADGQLEALAALTLPTCVASSGSHVAARREVDPGRGQMRVPEDPLHVGQRQRRVAHHADGIPYLVPELVLLFKAKAARPKDHADFDGVLPLLSQARRDVLTGWLKRMHPGHPRLARLAKQ